ncbi:MAG: uroporphyrinogen-III C-methyltransferase, partial [Myxococcaceae bacterium]|nr:uroporphyrinogen-III C-methyltransferase [Myxococcaceae bacterium]
GAWFVVAAAHAEVNRAVAAAAEERRVFVNAVDDVQSASAYLGGVVRRGGVTVAISTDGVAPALAGLLREGLEAVLPEDLEGWVSLAREHRQKWRAAGVPIEHRRGFLLAALVAKYATAAALPPTARRPTTPPGFVSLVGAGPGDPGLITQKGALRLREADLVLYDALVSPETLALAGAAQRFFVGKRAGRKSIEQRTIEKLLIRAARRGKRVVRLKAGDPYVLGRGGEEALALHEAGVAYEVVPGITSAIAAAASIDVPVTHRGLTSSFLVVSGHEDRPAFETLAPGSATLVVLMGVARRAKIAERLRQLGWASSTPAAIVTDATTPRQWSWAGTLAELAQTQVPEGAPGVLIVGDVVQVASQLKPQKEARHVHG